MKERARILVAENERIIASDLEILLTDWGYTVPAVAASDTQALQMVRKSKPDLVIIDNILKNGKSGRDTAELISKKYNTSVILLSDWIFDSTESRKKNLNSFYSIPKPFDTKELRSKIKQALKKKRN